MKLILCILLLKPTIELDFFILCLCFVVVVSFVDADDVVVVVVYIDVVVVVVVLICYVTTRKTSSSNLQSTRYCYRVIESSTHVRLKTTRVSIWHDHSAKNLSRDARHPHFIFKFKFLSLVSQKSIRTNNKVLLYRM